MGKHGSKKELFTKKDGKEQTAAVNECKKKQSNKFEENKEEYHNVDKQFDKAGKDFCLLYKAKSRFIAHGAHQANSTLELQNQNIVKQLYKNSKLKITQVFNCFERPPPPTVLLNFYLKP